MEAQTEYNFLTGNGSNPINSKTVQQTIKNKNCQCIVYRCRVKLHRAIENTTSISLDPNIFMPLLKIKTK